MTSYIQTNLAEFTIIIGLILLTIEVWVLGLSTIVLLALGVSAILSGILALLNILPTTAVSMISATGLGAGLLTVLLWGPLKRTQRDKKKKQNTHSDFIGLTFVLDEVLSKSNTVSVKYSGVTWALKLSAESPRDSLETGENVVVVAVDVGNFTVMPLDE